MTGLKGMQVTCVTLSSPDPRALARFYEQLLGWSITTDEPDWVELPNPHGSIGLAFHAEANTSVRSGRPSPGSKSCKSILRSRSMIWRQPCSTPNSAGRSWQRFSHRTMSGSTLIRMGARFVLVSLRERQVYSVIHRM